MAAACRSIGDHECATLEAEAAREVFAKVGSVGDLATVDAMLGHKPGGPEQQGDRRRPRRQPTLGDSSANTCYEVNAEPAFSERPLGLATKPVMLRVS